MSFLMRRASVMRMCCSGLKISISSGITSSSEGSMTTVLSSTTTLTWSISVAPVLRSKIARIIWPFLPYSFLYAVASASSIASMIFSRGIPRSSSSWVSTELITFKSNILIVINFWHQSQNLVKNEPAHRARLISNIISFTTHSCQIDDFILPLRAER